MKKILFIVTSPIYKEKGSSLRSYSVLKDLSTRYSIDLLAYSLGSDLSIKGVNIYRTYRKYRPNLKIGRPTWPKIILDFLVLLKAIRLQYCNHYGVIHCEDFEAATIGYIISLFFDVKIVYNLHNRIADNLMLVKYKHFLRMLKLLERKIINKTSLIILNWGKYSNDIIFENEKTYLYYDKISASEEFIDINLQNYIVYCGNFEKYQGVNDFLRVFRLVDCNYSLVLIGQPTSEIIDFINKNNLKGRVILTGRLPVARVNYLIKKSLFGILPRKEGSCMKVINYIMWHRPVIAFNSFSNRELIKSGVNGFLYNSDNQLRSILERVDTITEDDLRKLEQGAELSFMDIKHNWNPINFTKYYAEAIGDYDKIHKHIKISIILPVYNRGNEIKRAIDSILCQTHTNWELLIIDSSTDETIKAIKPYLEDERIRYFFRDKDGVAAARNHGLEVVEGKYVVFLDSDDEFRADKLEKQLDLMILENEAFSICWTHETHGKILLKRPIKVRGLKLTLNYFWRRFMGGGISHSPTQFMIRRDVAKKIKYDTGLKALEDTDLVLRYLSTDDRILIVKDYLCVRHKDLSRDRLSTDGAIKINSHRRFKKMVANGRYSLSEKYKKQAFAKSNLSIAIFYLLDGEKDKGLLYLRRSISGKLKFQYKLLALVVYLAVWSGSFLGLVKMGTWIWKRKVTNI